ncbi:MAG: hypothetical protein SNG49_09855, partial [Rikenellaceae bacterium]
MSNKVISSYADVFQFLEELKALLRNPTFNLATDLDILLKKSKEAANDPYTTGNTMLALSYDASDVRD